MRPDYLEIAARSPDSIRGKWGLSREVILAALAADGLAIRHAHAGWMFEARARDPQVVTGGTVEGLAVPEEYCLVAVRQNGFAVGHLAGPSLSVRLEAVRQDPMALELIRDKTRDLVREGVLREPRAARFLGPASLAWVKPLVEGTHGNWLEYYLAA